MELRIPEASGEPSAEKSGGRVEPRADSGLRETHGSVLLRGGRIHLLPFAARAHSQPSSQRRTEAFRLIVASVGGQSNSSRFRRSAVLLAPGAAPYSRQRSC